MTGKITITFLGTGSAIPGRDRFQASTALRYDHGLILFDCGEGTQYQLRKFKVSVRKEIIICISHLHPDHFLGVPGLLASLRMLHYQGKVKIIGPKFIKQVIENIMTANFVKVDYEFEIIEISKDQPFSNKYFELRCVDAIHEANAISFILEEHTKPGKILKHKLEEYGIKPGPKVGTLQSGETVEVNGRLITPNLVQGTPNRGRIIAYSGDTSPNIGFAKELSKGCDILIHEATYPADMIELAEERNHSTFKQAAEIARDGLVKKLFLTHISPRIVDLETQIEIVNEIFGEVTVAYDGLTIEI